MASEKEDWARRDYKPIWDYWRDDEVLATVEAQADFPQGSGVAAPGTRWRIVSPASLVGAQGGRRRRRGNIHRVLLYSVLDCCDLSHAGDFALKRPINASSALRLLPPDRREA